MPRDADACAANGGFRPKMLILKGFEHRRSCAKSSHLCFPWRADQINHLLLKPGPKSRCVANFCRISVLDNGEPPRMCAPAVEDEAPTGARNSANGRIGSTGLFLAIEFGGIAPHKICAIFNFPALIHLMTVFNNRVPPRCPSSTASQSRRLPHVGQPDNVRKGGGPPTQPAPAHGPLSPNAPRRLFPIPKFGLSK